MTRVVWMSLAAVVVSLGSLAFSVDGWHKQRQALRQAVTSLEARHPWAVRPVTKRVGLLGRQCDCRQVQDHAWSCVPAGDLPSAPGDNFQNNVIDESALATIACSL